MTESVPTRSKARTPNMITTTRRVTIGSHDDAVTAPAS